MPELAQTEQQNFNAIVLNDNLASDNNFFSNIKVQVETPASTLCAGLDPKFEITTTKSGKQIKKTPKPPKSCGSRSFSSKESDYAKQGEPQSFQSYVAYDTACSGNIVDILIDMQNPITSLTPWLFAQIHNTKNYVISAADKTGLCDNIFL